MWARPVPFGAPGQVIRELLEYIEAIEKWDAERVRDLGAARECLVLQVQAVFKALK